MIIKIHQWFWCLLLASTRLLVKIKKASHYFFNQKLPQTHNFTHQIHVYWHSNRHELLVSISFSLTQIRILLIQFNHFILFMIWQSHLQIWYSLRTHLLCSSHLSQLLIHLFLTNYLLTKLLLQLISFLLYCLILSQIHQIAILSLEISFAQLTIDTFLNYCIIF